MILNFRLNVYIYLYFKLMSVLFGYKYYVIYCVFWYKKKYYCEVGIVCGVKNRDLDRNGIDVYR